jgi:uncharacterized protein (TIGR03067 family)
MGSRLAAALAQYSLASPIANKVGVTIRTFTFYGRRDMKLATGLLLFCVIGTIAADDPKKTDDADAFKGAWKTVSVTERGQPVPPEIAKKIKFRFDGKNYVNTLDDMVEEGGYTIDASKTPRTIDFDIKTGDDKGKKQLGIYKFDGDKITIVVAMAGSNDRPTTFKSEAGSDLVEFVLEREKA